jgi:hypothetical protein
LREKKPSKSKRIIKAVATDGLSYIVGLSRVPLPIETLKTIRQIKRESYPTFVDWELRDWLEIYHQELGKTVTLPFGHDNLLLPQVLVFDNVKSKLGLEQVTFQIESKRYELPVWVKGLTEKPFQQLLDQLKRHKSFYNDTNVRLIDVINKGDGLVLVVQPVEYQYYVHTNLVLDARKGESESLRQCLHAKGKLEALSESPLANNLGISILLFTTDNSLIVKKRMKVAFRSGEWDPSVSGTVSLVDLPINLMTLCQMPHLREAIEELGVQANSVKKIALLGITRELIRGGEPELFFFGETSLTENEVERFWKDAKDKDEAKELSFFNFGVNANEILNDSSKAHHFLLKVDDFLEKHIDKASIPLLTSLAFWIQYRLEEK